MSSFSTDSSRHRCQLAAPTVTAATVSHGHVGPAALRVGAAAAAAAQVAFITVTLTTLIISITITTCNTRIP